MEGFGNQIQSLMNEFYDEWRKEENKGKSKWDVLNNFSEVHQMAVVFGNFNYQVENGGIHQWIYNGYFHDDSEKLIAYLESGKELDERCQKILDTIYKLDQNARDTDCDSDGYYIDPDDEDSEQQFIGDMINCNAFDNWYYENCEGDGWWKTVCGVIEKATGYEFAPVQQDKGAEGLSENANITNVINGELSVGDTIVSHSAGELSFLAGIVRSINKLGSPEHDTGNAGDDVYVDFSALEYSPRRISEIEFAFRKAYGERRVFDDLPLDEVIMAPDMLIRANNLDLTSRDEMYDILESDEGALDYCNRILSAHGLHIDGLNADVAPMPQAEQSTELMDAKLYSPVFVDLWEFDEYGSYPPESEDLSQGDAAIYIDAIRSAIEDYRKPDDTERGLMEYFGGDDDIEPHPVDAKVKSLFLDVEIHDGKLWAVASLKITEPLTQEELNDLREYIEGQYSDGWGEAFEQSSISIEGGEINVHFWRHDELFLDTQEQFAERLGIALPADALSSLISEPVANIPVADSGLATNSEIATLREKLIERAEQNWTDFRHAPHSSTPNSIYHDAVKVVGHRDAYCFIKDYDGFNPEQLNCLLQFANPVELISDYLDPTSEISDMAGILNNILQEQEDFKKSYALATDADTPNLEERVQSLQDRLGDNFAVYKRDMLDLSTGELFESAAEIASVQQVRDYFCGEHHFSAEQADFLLKLQNPLDFLSDSFSHGISDVGVASDMAKYVFSEANMERTLKSGSYELTSSDLEAPTTTINTQDRAVVAIGVGTAPSTVVPTNGAHSARDSNKPSVIAEIRQSQQEARERHIPPKEKDNDLAARKKSEHDL